MFRVVPPHIIRSTKLYLQHLVLVKPLLLPAAIVEELGFQLELPPPIIRSTKLYLQHLVLVKLLLLPVAIVDELEFQL